MLFVETPVFSRERQRLLSDEAYRALQLALVFRPEQGVLMSGTGGLRKIRWGSKGRGKRGGLRVIYYWEPKAETFYLLLVYPKAEQEDLTLAQLRVLKQLVCEEFK